MTRVQWKAYVVPGGAEVDVIADNDSTTPVLSIESPSDISGGGVTVDNGSTTASVSTIVNPAALLSGSTATMRPVIVSTDNPGAVGAGFMWLRLAADGNTYQLYARNDANTEWILASAGLGKSDSEAAARQVGVFNVTYGAVHGLEADQAAEQVILRAVAMDGSDIKQISISMSTGIIMYGPRVRMTNLPTADPAVAGELWVDTAAGRVLKVSAG